jgi:hypothetical protein
MRLRRASPLGRTQNNAAPAGKPARLAARKTMRLRRASPLGRKCNQLGFGGQVDRSANGIKRFAREGRWRRRL